MPTAVWLLLWLLGSIMDGDLEFIIGLAEAPAGEGHDQKEDGDDDGWLALDGAEALAAIEGQQDLAIVAQLAEKPSNRHEKRSWQLMEMARARRSEKKLAKINQDQNQSITECREVVASVAAEFPLVAKLVGLPSSKGHRQMTEQRAGILCRLALTPVVQGSSHLRLAQMRAASLMHSVCSTKQSQCRDAMFESRLHVVHEHADSHFAATSRINMVSWQFDETSQKIKGLLSSALKGERVSHGHVSAQIMVHSGKMCVFEINGDDMTMITEPWLARPLVLKAQTANHLLEGILRCHPLPLEDRPAMQRIAAECEFFVIYFNTDRASANFSSLSYIWHLLDKPDFGRNLLPFFEPCAAHGVALMKHRPQASKQLLAASSTFACITRQWRIADGLRCEVLWCIQHRLEVVHAPMPDEVRDRGLRFVELIFGARNQVPRSRALLDGSRETTRLGKDLDELISVMDMSVPSGDDKVRHWCFVREGSPEHRAGRAIGSRCCDSPKDSIAKLAVPFLNLVVHRGWAQCSQSRWTHVMSTLKHLCIGFASRGILPSALRSLKATWKVDASMIKQLELLVAAEENNFHAKSQLRLLRVCDAFCQPSVSWQVAVEITTLSAVDSLLFAVLGDGCKDRATLKDFVAEHGSLLAEAQQSLLRLLQAWGPDAAEWSVFAAMGGQWDFHVAMLHARKNVLVLLASLHDHYVVRMSQAPFTWFKLDDPVVDEPRKAQIVRESLDTPLHCMSLFSEKFQSLCPTEAAFRAFAPKIMQAVSAGGLSVDASERAHAHMRVDLRSTGPAKNVTGSCNRTFCQDVRAAHRDRTKVDPLVPPPPPALHARPRPRGARRGDPAGRLVERRGGSARREWQNSTLRNFKATVSPNAPLTNEQLSTFYDTCRIEWAKVSHAARSNWRHLLQGTLADMGSRQDQIVPQHTHVGPLWSACLEKHQHDDVRAPVSLHRFCEAYTESSVREQQAKSQFDPDLFVDGTVRNRMVDVPHDMVRKLCGCSAKKKNVCREILPDAMRALLDALTAMTSAWVDTFGAKGLADLRLVLYRGQGELNGAVRQIDFVALLIDARFSPKVQYFAMCTWDSHPPLHPDVLPDQWPVEVALATVPSTISSWYEAVDILTSDSLGMKFIRTNITSWSLIPLRSEIVVGSGSLLRLRILGAEDKFVKAASLGPRRAKAAPVPEFAFLDLPEDPFAHGERTANSSGVHTSAMAASADEDVADAMPDGVDEDHADLDGLTDLSAGLPPDLAFDMAEEIGVHTELAGAECLDEVDYIDEGSALGDPGFEDDVDFDESLLFEAVAGVADDVPLDVLAGEMPLEVPAPTEVPAVTSVFHGIIIAGLKSFDVAPSGRASCYLCGAIIPKGSRRFDYRIRTSRNLSDQRRIHTSCVSRLPTATRDVDIAFLRAQLATAIGDVELALLRAALHDIAGHTGASSSSSSSSAHA